MKFLLMIQRLLASMIDLIIIYLPVLLISSSLFRRLDSFNQLIAALIFIIYNVLAVTSFEGKTIGKYFAKLRVQAFSKNLADVAQREGIKILYLLPLAGWFFIIVSLVTYSLRGQFLHDWLGKGQVIINGR
ncbi:MAG TPA: RDD family protein [Lactococcus sp.]|uniref:RDD family protein n=1 Tax=Lactococcus TaxID=1357 RepID=UPI000E9E6F5B|nr:MULTISPECIES: RDD family protein [Lactococcus]HAP14706.1 RDD family protein [Lactococcus sp.]HBC89953.1 RDD family protein [Lactococcus sp.]